MVLVLIGREQAVHEGKDIGAETETANLFVAEHAQEFSFPGDPELVVHLGQVTLYRALGDEQFFGNVPVSVSLELQFNYFLFPPGNLVR